MAAVNEIEIFVNTFLQGLGTWLAAPMQAVTALGYEQLLILLLPTIYWCFDQMMGLRVGIIFMLGNAFNTFFKFLFHSPRPYWVSDQVKAYSHERSFGLPSGHAQIAATMLGWLVVEINNRWFRVIALISIFLIGLSRLYLGVHFLSDVLLGWALGGLLVWAFALWQPKVGAWISKQSVKSKLALVLVSAAGLLAMVLGARWVVGPWEMPADWVARAGDAAPYNLEGVFTLIGIWFGMLGGYVLLTATKGHFLAGEGGVKRLYRYFLGSLGLFILYLGLGQIFPDEADFLSYALRILRYTLIGLWVSWLAPVVFEKMKLLKFKQGD
jgi:membrane-associated phospholipid phosphatase